MSLSGRKKSVRSRGWFGSLLRLVAVVASYITALVLLLALLSPYVHPSYNHLLPLLGLATPWLYILSLSMALFWIVRWRWRIAAPILFVLLIGLGKVTLYAKIETRSDYGERDFKGSFEVMSYNVRGLRDDGYKMVNRDIAELLKGRFPSIVCLQECNPPVLRRELEDRLIRYYNYVVDDVAILSRFKIIHKGEDLFPPLSPAHGRTQWADLLVGKDTVRLFNLHLLTTNIQSHDENYISSREFIGDTLRENRLIDIASRLSRQSRLRAGQVDTIATAIAASPYRTIVCGDFNDTPISYTYSKLSRGMEDAFQMAGSGYPHTFRGFMNMLRIDYILTQQERFDILDYAVEYDIAYSDHYPVTAKIKLK